jgi:hypothetical protein
MASEGPREGPGGLERSARQVGSERSARRVGEFEVEVSYPCGHVASFARADDQPFSAADVGEVLLTSCTCAEEPS